MVAGSWRDPGPQKTTRPPLGEPEAAVGQCRLRGQDTTYAEHLDGTRWFPGTESDSGPLGAGGHGRRLSAPTRPSTDFLAMQTLSECLDPDLSRGCIDRIRWLLPMDGILSDRWTSLHKQALL